MKDEFTKTLALLFCGDIQGYFTYKKGPELIKFFNDNYEFADEYGPGFPTRWIYAKDKIDYLYEVGKIDLFLNHILDKRFIMKDCKLNEIDSIIKRGEIINFLNQNLLVEGYSVINKNGFVSLIKEDERLENIGEGGFAIVYKINDTGMALKKLKDEFVEFPTIRSRFKREYELTKSLGNIKGVIEVFDYDDHSCSYTMKLADSTLEEYINKNKISEDEKIDIIRCVMETMSLVHDKDVIHRDLSPLNIMIIDNSIKISDFGLGKDLNGEHSHKTMYTKHVGQYRYCAPEQFSMLKEANKKSDVYSLGKVINFIMTKDHDNSNHFLKNIVDKATNSNPEYRFLNSKDMLESIEKSIKYHQSGQKELVIEKLLAEGNYNLEMQNYIYELSDEHLCKKIIEDYRFKNSVIKFITEDEIKLMYILEIIDKNFKDNCYEWEDYDQIASLVYYVLDNNLPYVGQEIAARVLVYIAKDINRFDSQRKIKSLIGKGVDPLIEEILEQN